VEISLQRLCVHGGDCFPGDGRYSPGRFAGLGFRPLFCMEIQMFVTPAFAQSAPVGGEAGFLFSIMPFLLIFVIMYFLVIRPQQRRVKAHKEMIAGLRRGDTVVTAGGLIGKVTKVVDDSEIEVQIADNVKVRVARGMVTDVRAKGEPVSGEA